MAAGSQLEKGIWALLVNAAITIRIIASTPPGQFEYENAPMPQLFCPNKKAILAMISTSPTRFVKIVRSPALAEVFL